MEGVTTAVTNAVSIVTSSIGIITENSLLMVFLGMALVRGGLGVFKKAKKAVR